MGDYISLKGDLNGFLNPSLTLEGWLEASKLEGKGRVSVLDKGMEWEHTPGTKKHCTVAAALQRQSWKDQWNPFYKSPGELLKNSGLLLKSHWKVLRESNTIRYTV